MHILYMYLRCAVKKSNRIRREMEVPGMEGEAPRDLDPGVSRQGQELRRVEPPSRRKVEIEVEGLNEPISHYVDAVRFGDLLFISGCAPLDESGGLVGEDTVSQARQVLENMARILRAVGSNFGDVLKVTVYLTDMKDRSRINAVRRHFFGLARPASTLVEVSALAVPGMKIEIEAIAGIPP